MDFPRTIDEITPEWLTKVLRESGAIENAKVESFSANPLQGGFVSDIFRLELVYGSYDDNAPQTVITKMSLADAARRERLNDGGLYKREVSFYRTLAPAIGMRAPAAYVTEFDSESGFSMILLEDIGHLRAVAQYAPHASEGLNLNDALAAIDSLVSLHARWWNDDSVNEYPWLGNARDTAQIERSATSYAEAVEPFLETFGEFLPDGYESIARSFGQNAGEVMKLLGSGNQTLNHGDFRLDNIVFDDAADGIDRVVAFDWQGIGVSKAAVDISYFIAGSVTTGNRRDNEQTLLSTYYEGLKEHGITNYSKGEFEADLQIGSLRMAAVLTTSSVNLGLHNLLESEEGLQLVKIAADRLQTLVDWNCDEVIPKRATSHEPSMRSSLSG